MACGIEFGKDISKEKADDISNKFDLIVKSGYKTKNEKVVGGRPNSYSREGRYNGFIIEVKKELDRYTLVVRGSLHKYYHGNNASIFHGYEILEAVKSICIALEVEPSDCEIYNMELGINIPVWFLVYPYLKANLIYHKRKGFKDIKSRNGIGFCFKHDDYLLKLYQKDDYLLRYEIKFTSVKKLNDAGIYFLSDIKENTINHLSELLPTEFEEVIMRDGLNILDKTRRNDLMTITEREKLIEYSSTWYQSSYLEALKRAPKAKKEGLRKKSYRLKMDCLEIINKYGSGDHNNLHQLINQQVEDFKNSWTKETRANVPLSPIAKSRGENGTLTIGQGTLVQPQVKRYESNSGSNIKQYDSFPNSIISTRRTGY
jgi:hypothetical protein